MTDNKVYDKEYLAKLGITPDTDPNDPSTWSESLKKRHSNTVSSLPQEVQKRVKIAPTVASDTNLQAEIVGNTWKDNISKKYDSLVEQSQARYDGDGEDGRPGKVDPKEWTKLTAEQKKAVVEFVRAKRFHDLIRQPENLDVHGAIHYDQRIFHGIGPRVDIESVFYPLNKKIKTDAQQAEKDAAHKKALEIVKAYDEWGVNRTDEFRANQGNLETDEPSTEQMGSEEETTPVTSAPVEPASNNEPSQRLAVGKDENGFPNITYTAPNGAVHEQRAIFSPAGKIVGHVGFWKTKQGRIAGVFGPYALDDQSNAQEKMTDMAATLSQKLDKHIEKNPNVYEDRPPLQGMGISGHFSQTEPARYSNADLYRKLTSEPTETGDEEDTEESGTPSVEEQTQAQAAAGSNVSSQMIEAGVAPGQSTEEPWQSDDPHAPDVAVTIDGKRVPWNEFLKQKTVSVPKINDSDRPQLSVPASEQKAMTFEEAVNHPKAVLGYYNWVPQRSYDWRTKTTTDNEDTRPAEYDTATVNGVTFYNPNTLKRTITRRNGVLYTRGMGEPTPADWKPSKPSSRKVPAVGEVASKDLPKEQRFAANLRPTNVSEDHWNALGELGTHGKVARSFISMYAQKWHDIKDKGTKDNGTGFYTLDQLKSDRDAIQRFFSGAYGYDKYNGGYFRAYRDLNKDKVAALKSAFGEVPNDGFNEPEVNDALGKGIVSNILRAYPMPE